MSRPHLIEISKVILADSYALCLKTQNYHWNVEGPNFKAIHELLEQQYLELSKAIDELAEIIRTFGEKAPGTFKIYQLMTKIEDGDDNADASSMIEHLANDQEAMIKRLEWGIELAQKQKDDYIGGFFAERIGVHRKNHWMLISMLK